MLFYAREEVNWIRKQAGISNTNSTRAARTNQFAVNSTGEFVRRAERVTFGGSPSCDRANTFTFGTRGVPLRHAFALIYDHGGGFVSLDAGLPN